MENVNKKHGITYLFIVFYLVSGIAFSPLSAQSNESGSNSKVREHISLNNDWKFLKYKSIQETDKLIYNVRPELKKNWVFGEADDKPTEARNVDTKQMVLKGWILPCSNDFIKDPDRKYTRPEGNPGSNFPFVQQDFDDSAWEKINLPHDWAISGPFYEGDNPEVSGGMGRLPVHGVAWYRKKT